MSTVDTRCPSCGSLLRGDSFWCTLCYADLRPAPDPEPEPAPDPGPADPAVGPAAGAAPADAFAGLDPLTAPLDQLLAAADAAEHARAVQAALPPVAPESSGEGDDADVEGIDDTEVMFALLRGQTQDPILAKWGQQFSTPAARTMVIVGGASALTVVFFVLFSVLGFIFR